jgi:S1-C subfamily serine protease
VRCPGVSPTPGTIEASSATSDLAVVRIGRQTPEYLALAPPRSVRVGDPVFTVGFPVTEILGQEPTFTDGSVSALSGVGGEASLMQVTVPVQPGSSGGPLLNDRGEVVGIITSSAAVAAFVLESGTLPQNVNWAMKAEYAAPLFEPPSLKRPLADRASAASQALKATCLIEAATTKPERPR